MSQTEVKICRDCKWQTKVYSDFLDYCLHPKAHYNFSIVTGKSFVHPCVGMREYESMCGPEAKLWEPSLWKRIKLYLQPKSKTGNGNHE